MRLTVQGSELTLDVDVTIVDPAVALGEVYQAITGRPAGSTISIDGWPYRTEESVGGLPLHNGSVVAEATAATAEPTATVMQVVGHHSGRRVDLAPGRYDIGRTADDAPTEPTFRVDIDPGRPPVVTGLARRPVWVDGEPVGPEDQRVGTTVRTSFGVFRIRSAGGRPPVLPLVDGHTIPFRRSPRSLEDRSQPMPTKPDQPQPPQPAQPFSWLLALAPIPIGIVVALLFSPFFLVFALMSPILTAARWLEGRRRFKKASSAWLDERRRLAADYGAALAAWTTGEIARRNDANPDLSVLADRVSTSAPGLWERRPGHPDHLSVTVGIGAEDLTDEPTGFDEVDAISLAGSRLSGVPVTIDLAHHRAIGVIGPPKKRRAAATSMLAELAINHGPGDLTMMLLLSRDRIMGWDWCKWLPHLEDDRGFRYVVTDHLDAGALLDALPRPDRAAGGGVTLALPTPLVVVDGPRYLDGDFTALSSAVRAGAATAIVLAERAEDLPAICSSVVTVDDGLTVTAMDSGRVDAAVLPRLLSPVQAVELCRGLAAFADPERPGEASTLPRTCTLRSLTGIEWSAAGLAEAWTAAGQDPEAVLGVAVNGPLRLNLVSDGPHALVAGTTGSGKSELLRTLVASLATTQGPDRLNFVLVDFKGGGAFDACQSLPHTVGLVTDLDEHLAARALRCLKAELRYREQRLRAIGISDLRDYDGSTGPLPRLVVVVDEFATLAAELPEFMASLVDIAQRGRSLGIHMILATQRPAGVVDAKIRANTNLRISLRVQDEADSVDILNDKRAAAIDRRSPGRGYLRLGASELAQFQTAIVSQQTAATVELPLRVTTFELLNSASAPEQAAADDGPTDLEQVAAAARRAADALGLAEPRIPWPAALPAELAAEHLVDGARVGRWEAPLGLADLPDDQRTEVYRWTPELGNLAIYGTDATSTSAAVTTMLIGLARGLRADEAHMYIVDFSGGGALSDLGKLDQVGAVVTAQDEERLLRLIDLLDGELTTRGEAARAAGAASLGPGDGFPLLVLAIANYGGLMAYLEESNQFELASRFERFVRDGAPLGLFVVATANQDRGIPSRVAGQIESKLVMRLADPSAYAAFGLRVKDVPELGPCRAIDIRTGVEVQIARYAEMPSAGRAPGRQPGSSPDRSTGSGGPRGVSVLATDISPSGLVERSKVHRGGLRLVIGRRHADLGPAICEQRPGGHLVVVGGGGSGKTTALRAILAAAGRADPHCRTMVVSDDLDGWPDAVAALTEDLIDPEVRTIVAVDGIASIGDEAGRELERLAGGPNLCVVVAERPELLSSPPSWFRSFSSARNGLLLRPQTDHGEILRVRLPHRGAPVPWPGRGYLVTAGVTELIQVANVGPDEMPVLSTATSRSRSDAVPPAAVVGAGTVSKVSE